MRFSNRLNVCVDFDGTLVEHRFPGIGPDVPGAFAACREMEAAGLKLILLTMRHDRLLDEAVAHCRDRGLRFFAVNDNPDQDGWIGSRKVFGHAYIDDVAVGCPLVPGTEPASAGGASVRAMVDWPAVMRILRDAPQPA